MEQEMIEPEQQFSPEPHDAVLELPEFDAAAQNPSNSISEFPARRTRGIKRDIQQVMQDFGKCRCGKEVSPKESGITKCKRKDCETQWVSESGGNTSKDNSLI